ncbi:MAG: hypothetical protein Q9182_007563 [Xanthomendoza sp. 2 TL-2023]
MRTYVAPGHLRYPIRSTSLVALPAFVPLKLQTLYHCARRLSSLKSSQESVRRLASTATGSHTFPNGLLKAEEKGRFARRAITAILDSKTATRGTLWASLLEPYLPQHLQHLQPQERREADAAFADAEKPVPVRDLHIWLAEARKLKEPEGSLLTYLAVKHDRLDAVVWLVDAMLKEHAKGLDARDTVAELPVVSQGQSLPSLEDLTRRAGKTADTLEVKRSSGLDLNTLTGLVERSASRECLGEIWRSVGSMILEAADYELASVKARSIMACVLRILANLHNVGAVPLSIYTQNSAADPSVFQRPPTLYFWSLRMITDLADACFYSMSPRPSSDPTVAFTLQNTNDTSGNGSPEIALADIMPEVEPQLWLDLVLWCCVDGGWITEAAELVHEMWTKSTEGRQYAVIDWHTLREQTAPKLPWTTRLRLAIKGSRIRDFEAGASLGIHDERPSLLKPPERTVSSEVIAALVDALVNTTSSQPNIAGNKPSNVEKYISICKMMLDREELGPGSNSWNSIILRMYETLSSDPNVLETSILERVIGWSSLALPGQDSANSKYHFGSTGSIYVAEPSALVLGLLHRLLLEFALAGDFPAAVRIFKRLQEDMHANRTSNFEKFKIMLAPELPQDDAKAELRSTKQLEAPGPNLQLAPIILAPFLELITDAKDFDLGRWLLYSDELDGCTITPNMFTEAVLQPALIRFASAADDEHLLDCVTRQLKTPLSEGVLRALLHHQIHRGYWQGVNEIFELFRDVDGLAWDATDVMVLAGAVLRLEKSRPKGSPRKSDALWPGALLQRLMRGQYNTAQDPSKARDFSQTRMLNQLARVIASVPSELSRNLTPFCGTRYNQLSASCDVPPRAFNALLSSVAEALGISEGRQLCERWCLLGNSASHSGRSYGREMERVVKPDVQTFYTFLHQISQARLWVKEAGDSTQSSGAGSKGHLDRRITISVRPELEQSVIDWAAARCLERGATWSRIKQDFRSLEFS